MDDDNPDGFITGLIVLVLIALILGSSAVAAILY